VDGEPRMIGGGYGRWREDDLDATFAWINKMYEQRHPELIWLNV
jgi:hypothetical protein